MCLATHAQGWRLQVLLALLCGTRSQSACASSPAASHPVARAAPDSQTSQSNNEPAPRHSAVLAAVGTTHPRRCDTQSILSSQEASELSATSQREQYHIVLFACSRHLNRAQQGGALCLPWNMSTVWQSNNLSSALRRFIDRIMLRRMWSCPLKGVKIVIFAGSTPTCVIWKCAKAHTSFASSSFRGDRPSTSSAEI